MPTVQILTHVSCPALQGRPDTDLTAVHSSRQAGLRVCAVMLRNIALRDVCYHSQSFPASVCFQWRAPAHGANKSRLWNLLRAFFFIATTEIFGKHFMDISNFPLCKHFHWTRFIRSKNCHGSTEVNGVNPTNRGETDSYHYRSEVKSKEKKRTGYL